MTRLRAHFDGKVLVPTETPDLPKGKIFEVDVRDEETAAEGSPAALLSAVRQGPHLTQEEGTDLEQCIKAADQPARFDGVFDDLSGSKP